MKFKLGDFSDAKVERYIDADWDSIHHHFSYGGTTCIEINHIV